MTARLVVVPGPGLDERDCAAWATEAGIEIDLCSGHPAAVLGALAGEGPAPAGTAGGAADGLGGVVVAPGAVGLDDPRLARAVAAVGVPVVAVEPGNLRKNGLEPEATRLIAAGGHLLYGRGADTGRHAILFLARRQIQVPDTLAYGRDPSQEGDLWLPAGDGPHPVAVIFHGGFWYHAWERDLMDGLALDLAGRGIAAWNVEYRRVGAGGGWPATGEDAGRATEHLAALAPVYGLDLSRVAVLGHSAGAQLALWVAARRRRASVHPALAVGLATIADLEAARSDRLGGGSVTRLVEAVGIVDPEVALADASPQARLPIGVPQILAHAVNDDVVPMSQTTRYADAARAAGDDVSVLEVKAGGHFDLIDPRAEGWAAVASATQERLGGLSPRPGRTPRTDPTTRRW
jgi:acetyl esterase/lipase